MEINVEKLIDTGMRYKNNMDAEDMAALKLCLLSTGALMGLSVRNPILRRVSQLACTVLAAGLAVPLVSQYLDQLREEDPLIEVEIEVPPVTDREPAFDGPLESEE